jgi:hypothetical protein
VVAPGVAMRPVQANASAAPARNAIDRMWLSFIVVWCSDGLFSAKLQHFFALLCFSALLCSLFLLL